MKKTKYTPQAGDVLRMVGTKMVCYSFKVWIGDSKTAYMVMQDSGKTYSWALSKKLKLITNHDTKTRPHE